MGATGLAADPAEYRARLREQPDDQIDAWARSSCATSPSAGRPAGPGRVRIGATRLDDRRFERVFAAGGGPPATFGRDARRRADDPGRRRSTAWSRGSAARRPTGGTVSIEYLVENFEELVYV